MNEWTGTGRFVCTESSSNYIACRKNVGVLPIWKVKSNVSSVGRSCVSLTKGLRSKR